MRNIKITIQYDGTNFKGFQRLKDNDNTIQGKIEYVLSKMTNEDMMSMDPVILLSFINTKLRDEYSSLNLLCSDLDLDEEILKNKLHDIDYEYNKDINQFK